MNRLAQNPIADVPHGPNAGAAMDPPADELAATDAPRCRAACGACCIAPSISSAIPGMPHGKPAGVACVQLDAQLRCRLFDQPERPAVCVSLRPSAAMCGDHPAQAMVWLRRLEQLTAPDVTIG